jgi:uncharacterized protein YndB with AHSA1/START domain
LTSQTQPARRRITIERSFNAPIGKVWELWTTKDGIESWWGPPGFEVKVRALDVRRGGELLYAMTAVAPDQIDFLKKAGMPLTTESLVTYTEVVPRQRLVFTQMADFIPNVKPYALAMTVDFETQQDDVKLIMTLDAMHDEYWTNMMVMGWESELGKLADLLKRA